MNNTEHLLTILGEECNEVAQRVSKALRFGLKEIQKDQPLDNAQRIRDEYTDLVAVYELLVEQGYLTSPDRMSVDAKKAKVAKYAAYSRTMGTLEGEIPQWRSPEEWRQREPGEVVLVGDEFKNLLTGDWQPVKHSIGDCVLAGYPVRTRK